MQLGLADFIHRPIFSRTMPQQPSLENIVFHKLIVYHLLNRQKILQPRTLKPYLVLLVILLLAYLPVTTFHFAMKNDAFSDNFPNKFFLTQSLRSHFSPLWN